MPLFLLILWLLPCACYDWRQRRIPNWLTLPALPLALWWASTAHTLPLTLAVFIASYLAFLLGGMGGADGKLATVVAAISPLALLISGVMLGLGFGGLWVAGREERSLAAGPWFLVGSLMAIGLTPLLSHLGELTP